MAPFALWAVVRATLGIIFEEIREWVIEDTLWYCRIVLGLAEPGERNSSKFPVEFNDEGLYRLSEEMDIGLRHNILISRERSSQ